MTATNGDLRLRSHGTAQAALRQAGDEVIHERTEEQRIIGDLLRRAQYGRGGLVLVQGGPGLGKSLLLRAAAGQAAELGFSPVAGAADQLSRAIPLSTLRGALPEPFTATAADRHSGETGWWISQLRAHLEQRAAVNPVLVSLDDLQWADPATLAVLRPLSRELKWHPVAWILARRNGRDDAGQLFNLLETDGALRLSLGPLSAETVVDLLTDAFGAPPGDSLLTLAGSARGNPALLAELARGLAAEDSVKVVDGQAALVSAQLPRRMHDLAEAWLTALSERARSLLLAAAVLGPSFRLEDVAVTLAASPAALLAPLAEITRAGLMAIDGQTISFRHELLGRAVGDLVPQAVRVPLHRQYGQIQLQRGRAPVLAAAHLLQAAQADDLASLAELDAAAVKVKRSAPQTAADLALRALELTAPGDAAILCRSVAAAETLTAAGRFDQALPIARRTLARPLFPVAEARLRSALSFMLSAQGRAREAAAEARSALTQPQLPAEVKDGAATAQLLALTYLRDEAAGPLAGTILLDRGRHDGHAVMTALVAQAALDWDNGRVRDGLARFRDAACYSAGISPDARLVQPLLALAAALVDVRQLDEAEEILHATDGQLPHGVPAQATLAVLRARVHLARGRLAEASDAGRYALDRAEALAADGYAATAHGVLSLIELRRGNVATATQHAASQIQVAPHFRDLYASAETLLAPALISEVGDGPAAAVRHLSRIRADLAAPAGLVLGEPAAAAWLVRTALAAGDTELAAAAARAAQTLAADSPEYPALVAAAAHSLGLINQDPGRLAEAVAQHPDPWAQASAAEDLGALCIRQASRNEAIRHLNQAGQGYQQIGAAGDAARIRYRLRRLGVRRRHWTPSPNRPAAGWESLTDTERTASELAAQGLNNRQIASQMYVSVNTVAFYLRHTFRKLNIGSRVELARIVIEQSQRPTGRPHRCNN